MSSSVPLVKLYDTLLVPLGEELSDREVLELRERLARRLRQQNLRSLIIEVSAMTILDSFVARAVATLSSVATLLGVSTVLVGLSPAIAITLSEMGVELLGVETALNLEDALELLGLHHQLRGRDLPLAGVEMLAVADEDLDFLDLS